MIISYVYLTLILLMSWGVVRLLNSFSIQPILIQFIFLLCLIFGSHFLHFKILINLLDIKLLFIFSMCYLMSQIIHESVEVKPNKKIIIFSFVSLIIPFSVGFIVSFFYFSSSASSAIIMGLIYSVVAVPVLYIYLKELKYSGEKLFLYIQSAVAIDLLAWVVFALLQAKENYYLLLLCFILGFIPYISKIIKLKNQKSDYIYNSLFLIIFFYLEYNKLNGLLFCIIYLFSMRFNHINFLIGNQFKGKNTIQTHLIIPIIILYGLLQINFDKIDTTFNPLLIIILIIIPFISKVLANYIAFYFIGLKPDKLDAVILSTRGLTEIVFLNMAKQAGFINDNFYFYLILMSLFSTIIPGILIEKRKKYENITRKLS